jgi:hypothetical protein
MIRNLVTLFSVALFSIACNSSRTTTESSVTESPVANSGGSSLQGSAQFHDAGPTFTPSLGADQNCCTANVAVYPANDWIVTASAEWQRRDSLVPQTDLTLANESRHLLFTQVTQNVSTSAESYALSQANLLKSLGVTAATTSKATFNGVEYYLVTGPESNFNNWQWIHVKNNTAYIWGCGSPKGIQPDYDSCLDLMNSVQPQ